MQPESEFYKTRPPIGIHFPSDKLQADEIKQIVNEIRTRPLRDILTQRIINESRKILENLQEQCGGIGRENLTSQELVIQSYGEVGSTLSDIHFFSELKTHIETGLINQKDIPRERILQMLETVDSLTKDPGGRDLLHRALKRRQIAEEEEKNPQKKQDKKWMRMGFESGVKRFEQLYQQVESALWLQI